jgi:hypothetical protein
MFLGQDILEYLVLALGGAMFVGNVLALVKPPAKRRDDADLERAPVTRSVVMACVGLLAALWALASLVSG